MATAPATSELPSAASAKIPMLPLLLAVLLTGVLSVAGAGGALFYLVKSGRIPLGTAAAAPVKAPEAPVEVPSHVVSLDPMVVNLDDASGSAYLRLGMAVRVEDPAKKSKEEEKPKPGGGEVEDSMRDTLLTVVGRHSSTDLLAAGGKETLKKDIRATIAVRQPKLHVLDVYFTEFLVQR